jgi:glycerophosphoryl diester phosphodiesterase
MIRYILHILIIVVTILGLSCSNENILVNIPGFGANSQLLTTTPVPAHTLKNLEGIYATLEGSLFWGDQLVAKRSGKYDVRPDRNTERLSLFMGINAGYSVLSAGMTSDSSIILEGYWRFSINLQTGLVRCSILADEGGKKILQGQPVDSTLIIHGAMSFGSAEPNNQFQVRFARKLTGTFDIYAHRGGARNSDAPSASELSLNSIRLVDPSGANGVEMDVRLTADKIPILFHDDEFSTRTVNSDYLIGPVSNYPLAHIRALGTLKDGQSVPTLEEALAVVFTETNITNVWLDVKVPEAIEYILPLQIAYLQKASDPANSNARPFHIYTGLTSAEDVSAYLANPLHTQAPALCELEPSDVVSTSAAIWAPLWNRGNMQIDAQPLRAQGVKVIYWTLDDPDFINVFLESEQQKTRSLDGILTNYPSVVAYSYYIRR